jgi:hypothetical protein
MRDVIVIGARVAGSSTRCCWRARAWTCSRRGRQVLAARRGGRRSVLPRQAALAGYQRQRDRAAIPVYDFTTGLASFAPPPVEAVRLFEALERRTAEVDRFLGAITGSTPLGEYLSPGNLLKVIGARAMAGIMLGKLFSGRSRAAAATP